MIKFNSLRNSDLVYLEPLERIFDRSRGIIEFVDRGCWGDALTPSNIVAALFKIRQLIPQGSVAAGNCLSAFFL